MKRRKILSLLLAGLVTASIFVGCGKKEDGKRSKLDEMDKSPITFTIFSADLSEDIAFTDDVAKKITELTGVTLKFEHPVAGDTQAVPLMIAGGEYPDLIYAKSDTSKLVDAGAVIALDDYIEEGGDNLKALYGDQLNRLRYNNEDQSIYTVGTYGVTNKIFDPSGTMQLQHQVLKELGYPEIKNIKDYEKAIKDYLAKNPTTEDGQSRIGLSLMASDWRWLLTVGNIASLAAGIPDDGQFAVNDETGEANYKFLLPEVKEYFKWLNHMNAEGLLDPESFTQKEDTYRAKIAAGRVVGLSDAYWDYQSAATSLIAEGKDEATYAKLPVVIDETKYKDQSLKDYGFSGGWGIAITSSCEEPERAFQFLDWLASDEAQILLNWGIEGTHYTVNAAGKREFLPEIQKQRNTDADFSKKTGVGLYAYPFPQRGIGALDSNGDTYSPDTLENKMANYTEAEKETLKAYGAEAWPELFPKAEELGISNHGQVWQLSIPSDSDIAIIQKKADDYVQQAATQAILGAPENFDKAWDEIENTLKSYEIDKLNQGITELIKDRLELWNK
ncbi:MULTISPECIES: ABC transporter substrate-binding protein [Clostridium]|uniref:ABC transporter substrate-binding protein n=1 Tax=Clostridium TaxID=1485 RepID=UPI00189BF629|nr:MULTISPECIES: ABC transporter substrate-binding protein [Clostridium]MDI9217133.1 ABC transporter substrate-binding protein [Clostridium tertium]